MRKELFVKTLDNPQQDPLFLLVDSNPRKRFISLSHPINSKIIYYINFSGGHLILGLNEEKILTSLELNKSKDHWGITDSRPPKVVSPNITFLQFPNVRKRANENELPIAVFTDGANSFVSIIINGTTEINPSWIPISTQCYAEIKDNYLQGFWIILS